jgi:hypothetical protein
MFKTVVFVLAALACASGVATAGTPMGTPLGRNDFTFSPDGHMVIVAKHALKGGNWQGIEVPKGKQVVFDNFAKAYPDGTYACCTTWPVAGPDSGLPENSVAAAFTPTADVTADTVAVGLSYFFGTNAAVVTLNGDGGGVPGGVLATMKVKNMPQAGSCCAVMTAKVKGGVSLTAGTQYWVVVTTDKKDSTVFMAWNANDTEEVNPITGAFNNGSGWSASNLLPAPAFAVFGPK